MTMRERILAVVQGRPVDRVPFVQYDNLAAPNEEVWELVGRENMGLLRWSNAHRLEHPHCLREDERIERSGLDGVRSVLHTPGGDLIQEMLRDPTYHSPRTTRHFVQEPKDYEALIAYFRDAVVHDNSQRILRDQRELGEDGLPLVALERTPYQQLWIQWVGLENLCYHMADRPDIVTECMELMAGVARRIFDVVRRAPVQFVDFGDNITAPTIGEERFRRWCVPLYDELAGMLEERGAPVFVHMDGHLRPLWQAIGASKVRGLDSLSPPPDNDTDVGQAHAMWPEMRLFVNFPSSVHLSEPEAVYNRACGLLEGAGHSGRLQIQISENVPPGVWRRSFPQIVRAIQEFGPPHGP